MGDEEVFTPEEKVILGEETEPQAADQGTPPADSGEAKPAEGAPAPEAKPAEATPEPEHTEEEGKAAEAMGLRVEKGFIIDDDGTKIPAQRWKKLYHNYKETERKHSEAVTGKTETERKFNLYRILGPDKYYEIYTDEKPKDYRPPQGKATAGQSDLFEMVAQYPDPNHPYHGMTLKEIYKDDPAEGRRLERAWEQSHQQQQAAERQKRETEAHQHQRLLRESEAEIMEFSKSLANELYGKDVPSLSKEEGQKVGQAIRDTLDFMQKTRRGGGNIMDAHFIMNRDRILTDAKTKGGRAALESLQRAHVPSIGTGAGAGPSGMDAYEAMTPDQLAREIEAMPEKNYAAFLKHASPALRQKHPSIAWD